MTVSRYRLSFTTGSLLTKEAGIVAPLYLETRDWATVRQVVNDENRLQARTMTSGRRLAREVIQRLSVLTDGEIEMLVDSTAMERGHILWAAACRRYGLIGEFAEEVLRERFLVMTPTLSPEEFDSFVRAKAVWHEELTEVADSTLRKLRRNLFLMLREAGLVSEADEIVQAVLSQRVAGALAARTPSDVRFFPAYDVVTEGTAQ